MDERLNELQTPAKPERRRPMNPHRIALPALLILPLLLTLSGCLSLPPASDPIPVREVRAAAGPHERLVIVLPGRGDDLAMLEKSAIASGLQRAVPGTDVLLVEATLPYYMEGRLVARLHDEVITPARRRGYREIWLAGASMGGMGALMYEHDHPGAVTGLLLMAPFMGPSSLQKEIHAAGGIDAWDPGPAPPTLTRENVAREQWRLVKSWRDKPERARDVWLICGDKDRLRGAADLIATVLPPDHSLRPAGAHRWTVWSPAAGQAFASAIEKRAREQPARVPGASTSGEQRLLLTF
jgi:pimeloyl-ACP methyl ester carboxylesterase